MMTEHLEQLHKADGYEFNGTKSHICCMPHMRYVSCPQLLHINQEKPTILLLLMEYT